MEHNIDMRESRRPRILSGSVIGNIQSSFISLIFLQSDSSRDKIEEIIEQCLGRIGIFQNIVVEFLFRMLIAMSVQDSDFVFRILGQFVELQKMGNCCGSTQPIEIKED